MWLRRKKSAEGAGELEGGAEVDEIVAGVEGGEREGEWEQPGGGDGGAGGDDLVEVGWEGGGGGGGGRHSAGAWCYWKGDGEKRDVGVVDT